MRLFYAASIFFISITIASCQLASDGDKEVTGSKIESETIPPSAENKEESLGGNESMDEPGDTEVMPYESEIIYEGYKYNNSEKKRKISKSTGSGEVELDASSGRPRAIEAKKYQNFAIVNVFFATDRKENTNSDIKSQFGAERGVLKYGATKVSIPRDHRMGELESPSIWKLEFSEDPEKHIVVLDISTLDRSSYFTAVAKQVNSSSKKSAFIFVHGYNVTFIDAARRTAQMSYDLGFDGAPVFYSWPSYGSTAKYTFDEGNIIWAQGNIEKFLKDFAENSEAENIYIIAHSMGNRALTRAYISLIHNNPELKSRFTEIILAAPDIDAEVFMRDIAPAMVEAGSPVTLYASSEDIPLQASKAVHGGHPRAGDSGENIIIFPGIESIDSTKVNTGFLGHSYYADEKSIISDMFYIFRNGLRANERAGLTEVSNPDGVYWEFKK